jgi:hypothetical protein
LPLRALYAGTPASKRAVGGATRGFGPALV